MSKEQQEELLTSTTMTTIQRFNEAFNRQDIEATMAAMAEDCIFENTYPPPEGTRYQGQAAVRAAFEAFFHTSPQATFQTEEIFAAGDRGVVRWIYHWVDQEGRPGHIRGVDLFRVRDGQIEEKLSYVKG